MLTGAGDREADAGRVPRTDARHLAEPPVGLAGQAGDTPTGDHALGTVTLGGPQHVDALVLSYHTVPYRITAHSEGTGE